MISICMATYNGSVFIREQIDSILDQIEINDELIICDDCSTDDTVEIINSYADPRIKLFINEHNLGHVKNFEKAIMLAQGNFVVLSDQDDIWCTGRLQLMKSKFSRNDKINLVASNFDVFNETSDYSTPFRGLGQYPSSRVGRLIGIFYGNVPYFGCTFMMKNELAALSTPFPNFIEAHDVWIGLIANTYGQTVHIEESTLKRRIHGNNLTPPTRRPITVIVKSRLILMSIYLLYVAFHSVYKKGSVEISNK